MTTIVPASSTFGRAGPFSSPLGPYHGQRRNDHDTTVVGNPSHPASEPENGVGTGPCRNDSRHRRRDARSFVHEAALPLEIQLQIASHLDLKALLALRGTNRYWRWFIEACRHDALTVHPTRGRLLDLWDEWVAKRSFEESRHAVVARLEDWDREKYLEGLPAVGPGNGEARAEFEMWAREWPAKAAVGGVWPGMKVDGLPQEQSDVDGVEEGLPPLPEWYHQHTTNLLPPATFKHAFAWPLQGPHGTRNNWVHCRLEFEDDEGLPVDGGYAEHAAAGWNPLLLSRGMPGTRVRAWATGIRIQRGPMEARLGSSSGQVVLLVSGAGPLNGSVQACVEDIMVHQGSDYVAVRIPKGGRESGVCVGGWIDWLRERMEQIEEEYQVFRKYGHSRKRKADEA